MLTHGPMLVTRGASGRGSPRDLGSGLLAWWDPEYSDGLGVSAGLVASYRDLVRGYDAVAAGAARPTFAATGLAGRPGLQLDGAATCLTYEGTGVLPVGADPCEIWLLVDQGSLPADTAVRLAMSYGGDTQATRRSIDRIVTTGSNRLRGGVGTDLSSNVGDFSGRCVTRLVCTATTVRVDLNGVAGSTVAATPATGATRLRFGANTAATPAGFLLGVLGPALITAPLSTGQAAEVTAWFKARGKIA